MIIRLTKKLSDKLKVEPPASLALHDDFYADWSARLFTADRVQYILFTHTRSLYSIVMHGRGVTHGKMLVDQAMKHLHQSMSADGLEPVFEQFVAPTARSVQFARALNRSVTGSMNDLQKVVQIYLQQQGCSVEEAEHFINGMPMSGACPQDQGGYAIPRIAFSRLED